MDDYGTGYLARGYHKVLLEVYMNILFSLAPVKSRPVISSGEGINSGASSS